MVFSWEILLLFAVLSDYWLFVPVPNKLKFGEWGGMKWLARVLQEHVQCAAPIIECCRAISNVTSEGVCTLGQKDEKPLHRVSFSIVVRRGMN